MNMARVIDRGTLNVNTAHQLFYKGILTLHIYLLLEPEYHDQSTCIYNT